MNLSENYRPIKTNTPLLNMTNKEQQTIDNLLSTVRALREENQKFREDTTLLVKTLADRVEQKHIPLTMEQDIVGALNTAMQKAFGEALSNSYNSPLVKYAHNVVAKYQVQIESVFDKVVQEGVDSEEFKLRVREVLLHKIAKTITSGIDGGIDKTINLMKQDAIFRSRLTLSINTLIEEFLKTKQS